MNIVLLFGGRGAEHAVSVKSAAYVLRAMRERHDTCYPIGVNKAGEFFFFRLGDKNLIRDGKDFGDMMPETLKQRWTFFLEA